MVPKKGACEECVRGCQLLHWSKKDLEPRVTRFFKVMMPGFNEALFLPPKFAKSVKDLVDTETKLEDSSWICWAVTLSYYKNLLAFHKGWFEFSVDKDLKVGDVLVVNHVKEGHFVIQAYGKNGCEKLNVARKHLPVKRARTNENIAAENTPCQTTCKDARKRKSSSTSVQIPPTKTNFTSDCKGGTKKQLCVDNEFYLMVDRDAGCVQSDYRTCLYDLSSFEMQQNICFAGKDKKHTDGQEGSPDHAPQTSVQFQADPIETMVLNLETAVASNTDIDENNKDSGPICNMSFECDRVHYDGLSSDLPSASASLRFADNCIKGDGILNVAIPAQSPKGSCANLHQSPHSTSRNLNMVLYADKEIEMVKEDKVEMRKQASGCGRKRVLEPFSTEKGGSSFAAPEMIKVVKMEPVDSLDVPPVVATSFTCLAETNGCVYINLPDRLPSVTFHRSGRRAAVILEDPEGREWFGIYQEKFGFHVLVAPWHKVNAENGIQLGDSLAFSVENESLNKYKFDIVRKQVEH